MKTSRAVSWHDPEAAKVVVVSFYQTFAKRKSKVVTEEAYYNRHKSIRQHDTITWKMKRNCGSKEAIDEGDWDEEGAGDAASDVEDNDTTPEQAAPANGSSGKRPTTHKADLEHGKGVFRLIPTRYRGFCTATPTINRMADILGKRELNEFVRLGFKYWLLAPGSMASMSDRGTPDEFSQVLFQTTAIFTLRRGMDTMLTLPNGTRVFPRDAVPRSRIIHEEIRSGHRRAEVVRETNDILKDIKFVHHDAEDEESAIPSEDDQIPGLGMSISPIRALALLASCFNAWCVLRTLGELRNMDPGVLANSLQPQLTSAGLKLPSKRQAQKVILEKDMGESAKLGLELVEMIKLVSSDGPLFWIYTILVNRPGCLAPSGRSDMTWLSLWGSPLYLRIIELVLQYHREGKRVLVMVGPPWTQLNLAAILSKASFNVVTIRSSTPPAGPNLHLNCSRGVIASPTWNHNIVIQGFGRLNRIGQSNMVIWHYLHVSDSVFPWLEYRCDQKFMHEVMAHIRPEHPKSITLRVLVAMTIISITFGSYPFNHFAWLVEPPQSVDQYYCDRAKRLGIFYSSLAMMVVNTLSNE
ncbi:hypothetical protein RB599_009449 [Gaeumannomyces hyphopodioides]